MSRVTKTFGGSSYAKIHDDTNMENFPGFSRPLEERYVQCLMTNTLGNSFYASQKSLLQEAIRLHSEMTAVRKGESQEATHQRLKFAAKAIVYARSDGYMRTQPILGLAVLSGAGAFARALFEDIFPHVIRTPNDLMDFAAIIRSLRNGEGGRCIKRVAGKWLVDHITEYLAMKYGAKKRGGYSLRDLFRAYHPRAPRDLTNIKKTELVDYILGRAWVPDELPQVAALERLKAYHESGSHAFLKADCIRIGRLPHEVTTPFAGSDPETWAAIAEQMPIFALLRNLATIERHKIVDPLIDRIRATFTDERVVLQSKIFPYRFMDAMEKVKDPRIKDYLRDAAEIAMGNFPPIPGRTAVFLDISSSMDGKMIRNAAIYAIAIARRARRGRLLLFNTNAMEYSVSQRDSVLTQAAEIKADGGTDTSCPMRAVISNREKFDNIVLISDEQQNVGAPFYETTLHYRAKINPNAKFFIVNVSPYSQSAAALPQEEYFGIYGWSDRVMQFISMAARGFNGVVDFIGSMPLPSEYPESEATDGMGEAETAED